VVLVLQVQNASVTAMLGLVPARLGWGLRDVARLVGHMFAHGGLLHLVGNLWFLHVFGGGVEQRVPGLRFLAFFVGCGVVGGLAHAASQPASQVPLVGASGAISGVLGAYLRLHASQRMNHLMLMFFHVKSRVWVLVGWWGGLQLVEAFVSLTDQTSSVAFFAHVGGFVTGLCWMSAIEAAGPVPRRGPRLRRPHGH
jgi:membrane associated rhomboid family serine protease